MNAARGQVKHVIDADHRLIPDHSLGREEESVGTKFEEHFGGHAENEDVFGDLQQRIFDDAIAGSLEQHRDARTGRHQNHDPVQIRNESQQLVNLRKSALTVVQSKQFFST